MLDPWIIEEIRRQEEETKRPNEPLVIEAPLSDLPQDPGRRPDDSDDGSQRGVIVVDL